MRHAIQSVYVLHGGPSPRTRGRHGGSPVGHQIATGDEAGWGGIAICAATDAAAQEQLKDFRCFWDHWSAQFGQGFPEALVGSPDTISRRIEEAHAKLGFKECFLLLPQGIHTRDQILTSLDLLAKNVLPRFAER